MSKIKGIPDGWELVAFRRADRGDYFLNSRGLPEPWTLSVPSHGIFAIIRKIEKIEKPKKYRQFASAAEFEPFSDMWLNRVDNNGNELPGRCKINGYDDEGFWLNGVHLTFAWAFKVGHKFANGDQRTPFGIEVTE
jgi:hypothetical protein